MAEDKLTLPSGPITVEQGVDAQGRRVTRVGEPEPASTVKGKVQPNQQQKPGPIGNTLMLVVPKTSPNLSGSGKMPADKPEKPPESYWDKFKKGVKDGAQYYKDNVSKGLHDFSGSAMEKGGTIALAGGATAAVGGGVALTGVGAAPGAVIATAGGAVAAVGGGVTAVGGITETAATVLDKAADRIITGTMPDLVQPAIALGTSLFEKIVLKKVPGAQAAMDKLNKVQQSPVAQVAQAATGGYIDGPKLGGCIVGPYSQIKDKCGTGQQAHHIVADKTFGTTNRKGREKDIGRIPGKDPSKPAQPYDAPSICLQGQAKTEGTEHNTAHDADAEVKKEGQRTDNGPPGTAPVGKIMEIYEKYAILARPDCAALIKQAVKDGYKNVDPNQSGRTTDSTPKGDTKAHLESGAKSTDNKQIGGRKGKK